MSEPAPDAAALIARSLSGDSAWVTSDCDVPLLVQTASEHGVTALFWDALTGVAAARPIRSALEPAVHAAAAKEVFVDRDLQVVLPSLAHAGVQTMVIKGGALAYTVYPSPWMRHRGDTDLLIQEEDGLTAARALEACGYAQNHAKTTGLLVSPMTVFQRTDAHGVRHVIDLHRKVARPQVVAHALPFDLLWREGQHAVGLGPHARVPSAVASIVLACIHGLTHHQGHERLIWLYDLKLLTKRLTAGDWDRLRTLALERGVASLCLHGLRQARSRLGAGLPEHVESALAQGAPGEQSSSYIERRLRKRDVLVSDLRLLGSWTARMRLLREHAFPATTFIRQRYRTNARWLLPMLYVHRLVTGAYKWVRH